MSNFSFRICKCNNVEHKGLKVEILEEQVLSLNRAYLFCNYDRHIQPYYRYNAINAAEKIENNIGTCEAFEGQEGAVDTDDGISAKEETKQQFKPQKGKIRKSGTGGVYEINDHLFEGRFSPTNADGKREVHTVYAKTKEECEEKLQKMIAEVKTEIKAEKEQRKDLKTDTQ